MTPAALVPSPADDVRALLATQECVALATADNNGIPHCSTAPFAWVDGRFCIFVSQLSPHTQHLIERPATGILLVEDEQDARNAFARRRLILNAQARTLTPEDALYPHAMNALDARFGETMTVLRSLPDFVLMALEVSGGRLIRGFGQAFRVNGALEIIEHIDANNLKG